ncbi:MAG: hypothetical protein COX38_00500 [Candidatus Nealsonbacteria bacterium CG23_combo_of_CG06-09_8_20_14_all_39_25]|uniref:3D domain-containing protein n=2 Tax=Candidatus Nealsoniibacteriota TaxID=1817911 RepID=A0A2G9YT77_9BACT|nr:MAG: hypothetical protein COX38_00500 [Candidatus Nealsonbacteria bacterium CG23_combo_of_CG06-09_8_20_14_all_39_25]
MEKKESQKNLSKRSKKGKRKLPTTEFNNKLVRNFLISIVILLAILLILESVQIFFQFRGLTKQEVIQRPVYIVESQPIDLDAYLREYFTTKTPKKTMYVTVTAYSSTKDQTDGDPYLTGLGTPVRDGIVAANFLPVGTVVRFPDKFGEKIFVVEDRMHEKYGLQVDIWMSNQEKAKKFGIQYLKMEIF